MERAEPKVAYYCRMYALEQASDNIITVAVHRIMPCAAAVRGGRAGARLPASPACGWRCMPAAGGARRSQTRLECV